MSVPTIACRANSELRKHPILVMLLVCVGSAVGLWFLQRNEPKKQKTAITICYSAERVVYSLAFSPNNKQLISCGYDLRTQFDGASVLTSWNLEEGKELTQQYVESRRLEIVENELGEECRIAQRTFKGQIPLVAQFSPDGKYIVAGFGHLPPGSFQPVESTRYRGEGSIRFLDPTTLAELRKIDLKWAVYGLAISSDSNQVAAVGSGKAGQVDVGIWNLRTGEEKASLSFEGNPASFGGHPLRPIVFSRDDKLIYAATVSAWGPHRPSPPPGTDGPPQTPVIGEVQVISPEKAAALTIWRFIDGPVTFLDVAGDNEQIAVKEDAGDYSAPKHWRIDSNSGELNKIGDLMGATFLFLSGDKCGISIIADRTTIERPHTLPIPTTQSRFPFIAGIYDLKSNELRVGFPGSSLRTCSVALSTDEKWLAVGDDMGHINIWQMPHTKN